MDAMPRLVDTLACLCFPGLYGSWNPAFSLLPRVTPNPAASMRSSLPCGFMFISESFWPKAWNGSTAASAMPMIILFSGKFIVLCFI